MSFQTIATNKIFANESPKAFITGALPIFTWNFLGTGTIYTASYSLYRNKSKVLDSVAGTIDGRIVTTGVIPLSLAGEYQLEMTITDGSEVRIKACRIFVIKNGVY